MQHLWIIWRACTTSSQRKSARNITSTTTKRSRVGKHLTFTGTRLWSWTAWTKRKRGYLTRTEHQSTWTTNSRSICILWDVCSSPMASVIRVAVQSVTCTGTSNKVFQTTRTPLVACSRPWYLVCSRCEQLSRGRCLKFCTCSWITWVPTKTIGFWHILQSLRGGSITPHCTSQMMNLTTFVYLPNFSIWAIPWPRTL